MQILFAACVSGLSAWWILWALDYIYMYIAEPGECTLVVHDMAVRCGSVLLCRQYFCSSHYRLALLYPAI